LWSGIRMHFIFPEPLSGFIRYRQESTGRFTGSCSDLVSAVNGCLPVVWKTPDVTDPSLYEYTGIVKSHKEDPYEKAFTGHLPYGGDDVCPGSRMFRHGGIRR